MTLDMMDMLFWAWLAAVVGIVLVVSTIAAKKAMRSHESSSMRASNISDEFSDRSAWRQGFWGDLMFRLRLFMRRQRVVDTLNQVEGALEALATTRAMRLNAVPGWLPREASILAAAEADLLAAQDTLRNLLFGTSACQSVRDIEFDGWAESAPLVIDQDTEIVVRPDGSVTDGHGRPLPKSAILTHGRQL